MSGGLQLAYHPWRWGTLLLRLALSPLSISIFDRPLCLRYNLMLRYYAWLKGSAQ